MIKGDQETSLVWEVRDGPPWRAVIWDTQHEATRQRNEENLSSLDRRICEMGEIRADELCGQLVTLMPDLILKGW